MQVIYQELLNWEIFQLGSSHREWSWLMRLRSNSPLHYVSLILILLNRVFGIILSMQGIWELFLNGSSNYRLVSNVDLLTLLSEVLTYCLIRKKWYNIWVGRAMNLGIVLLNYSSLYRNGSNFFQNFSIRGMQQLNIDPKHETFWQT